MMRLPNLEQRTAGVLLHMTSLPDAYGSGDLGQAAYAFADFLSAARMRWWQVLPVHPPGAGWSPYNGLSAFAGSPLLIALEPLLRAGWLRPTEAAAPRRRAGPLADYPRSLRFREARLRNAYSRFVDEASPTQREALEAFCTDNAFWLDDYALFMALKTRHAGRHWVDWPADIRRRTPAALREARRALAPEVRYRQFTQHAFETQWQALRAYCAERGIGLLGDMPIFVSHDSADVWAQPALFHIDRDGRPPVVAGVPPDAFSADGQRWGNPLYNWAAHRQQDYRWWRERFTVALRRHGALRLDHFIGFVRYWEIPAGEKTARNGRFRPGPGADFFNHLLAEIGTLPVVAEDLGIVTPEVTALRHQFNFPGMRVLQFAFDDNPDNPYLPHNHSRRTVVYTGTHDNDTIAGWAFVPGSGRLQPHARRALEYLGYGANGRRDVHWALLRMAMMSPANTAIVPAQDVLGLDSSGRMNSPGTPRGNWRWRLSPQELTPEIAQRLGRLVELYGRAAGASPAAHES